jgi:hypothetical protein
MRDGARDDPEGDPGGSPTPGAIAGTSIEAAMSAAAKNRLVKDLVICLSSFFIFFVFPTFFIFSP